MSVRKNREAEVAVIRPAQPRSTLRAMAGATERRLSGALEIPVDQVSDDPNQPRRDWEHHDGSQRLEELAASIKEFGILQPLLVREEGTLGDGRQRYVIIAGARRHAAATRIGLATIPVIIHGGESTQVRVLQLIENVQRQDLSPLDEARAYQELIDTEDLSPPTLAARLHLSPQHVRDRLRLVNDQVLADAVERKQISATAARDILQLPENELAQLRNQVRAGKSVRIHDVAAVRDQLAVEGIANPRRKGNAAKKQTTFVSSVFSVPHNAASPAGTPSETAQVTPEVHQHVRQEKQGESEAEQLTRFAAHLAEIIGDCLTDVSRAQLAVMLQATHGDTTATTQWWLVVDAHLRSRYGR